MTKVRIISDTYEHDVADRVNEFITNRNILDLQFRVNGESQGRTVYSVMIIYEE